MPSLLRIPWISWGWTPASGIVKVIQAEGRKLEFRFIKFTSYILSGFLCGSDGKESTCTVGDLDSIAVWGRPLEEAMATHSSILACRIPMDKGA